MPLQHLFSPREAEEARREKLHQQRKTPLCCGNRPGKNRKKKPRRQPGDCYDVHSYRRAIVRGCDLAFPWPELQGRKINTLTEEEKQDRLAWQRQHRWHPHQLRHNAATYLRREFGVEAARLILGHRSIAVTELYAELDQEKAIDIISKVG
jgi:integrase